MKANKYGELLEGILRFKNLEEAEETLKQIDKFYFAFRGKRDSVGAARARYEIERGLRRAHMIAKNKRVSAEKREEKKEIALWFEMWLIDKAAFWTWLKMRKERIDAVKKQPPSP